MNATENQNLSDLLAQVDELFGGSGSDSVCQYHIGRFQSHWRFDLLNDWNRWESAGLKWQFTGETPQGAIREFLNYVQQHGIRVAEFAR